METCLEFQLVLDLPHDLRLKNALTSGFVLGKSR